MWDRAGSEKIYSGKEINTTRRKDLALEMLGFSLNQKKTHLKSKTCRGFGIH